MTFKRLLLAAAIVIGGVIGAYAPAFADPVRIVAFGDSLMAGYQLGAGEAFPERLEAALRRRGYDVAVANAGVSGDTTSGGLARLDWSVPDGTNLVILGLGANDMLRGLDPAIAEKNLDTMIGRLRERGIDVLLAGMLAAPNLGTAYGERFNAMYGKLADKFDLPLYPFLLDGVATQQDLLLGDGMHPNAEGVARMVDGILPMVEAELGASETAG